MSRCICETLRKWPVVANGTFRETTHIQTIQSSNNNNVIQLPKNTYIQIPNYLRHRDEKVWKNPNFFNPYRKFTNEEYENVLNLSIKTPESYRFSPFSHNNRSCIGKLFAQIEMRLILLYILKDYTFIQTNYNEKIKPTNIGTLAPFNLYISILNINSKL